MAPSLQPLSALTVAVLLCADFAGQWRALATEASPAIASARVMRELLLQQTMACGALLAAAGILFSLGAIFASSPTLLLALVSAFAAFVIERHQFFTACSGPRMTGN